jgi:hypothetical protein
MENIFKLNVCLASEENAWVSLLNSEGIFFEKFCTKSKLIPLVVIVPSNAPKKICKKILSDFYSKNLSVISDSKYFNKKIFGEKESIKFPYDKENFCGLRKSDYSLSFDLHTVSKDKSKAFLLPFSLKSKWSSTKHDKRFIHIGGKEDIFEEMCSINKKNLFHVIRYVLKKAFFFQGLPYVHKWYYPENYRTVLSIRGDADGGPEKNLKKWLEALKSYFFFSSVFFCVEKYQSKADLIKETHEAGLEVGSHNFWHIIFKDYLTNFISLSRAEKLISTYAKKPLGFVFPAYFWHKSMYKALEKKGYLYSSSFGLSHDLLPYYPVIGKKQGKVLEIPFHCLGDRFVNFGIPLDSEKTKSFFKKLIKKKYDAGEPFFFYGHPDIEGRMGNNTVLLDFIIKEALSYEMVKPVQLSEFSKWWKNRVSAEAEVFFDKENNKLKKEIKNKEEFFKKLNLRVESESGKAYFFGSDEWRKVGELNEFGSLKLPAPDDIGEMIYSNSNRDKTKIIFLSWKKRAKFKRFIKAYLKVYFS